MAVIDKTETSERGLTAPALRWGSPPLALLPMRIGHRLGSVKLPDWLTELLDLPEEGTVSALAVAGWDALPDDEKSLERIRDYVFEIVSSNTSQLRDVPIGGRLASPLDSLGLQTWPGRSRTALLRSGVGADPNRLVSLTFGDLLDVPHIGVRTALQTAALLEISLRNTTEASPIAPASADEAQAPTGIAVPRWGEPGSSLLPKTLRRAFADEALPPWLLEDLHLPPDATALALDSSVWIHLAEIPPRVERFLIGLVTYRAAEIRDLPVIDGVWPPEVRPEHMPWPTRVRNALVRAELLHPSPLESITYRQLLALPAMGVKSVLEFAAIADHVSTPRVLDETMRQDLVAAAEEDWVERVRADDARFRDVVPPHHGSLTELFEEALNNAEGARAHALAEALPHMRARAADIASDPLDVALIRLLKSVGASDRDIGIVVARFGWGGGSPRTLQEVGDEFSISRERVRQIVDKIRSRLGGAYLPQVEEAVQLVAANSPIAADSAAQLLVDKGLSKIPLDPSSLRDAAEVLGYEATFRADRGEGLAYVRGQDFVGTGPVFSAARREAARVGVSNVEEVQANLAAKGQEQSPDAVARILRSSSKIEFLDGEWFWMPDIRPERNRLRNVSQRMLSVAPRLDVATMRQGVRRRYRFMRIDVVPPVDVLKSFYAANPEFILNEDGTVGSAEPLDYQQTLGEVERVFVEVLRSSQTGLMDRAELEEAVTARGINPNTFSVFTTYSPILDHPAINVWCLRGHVVDPAQLEALRAVTATRTRQRRILAYGWDEDGGLWLTVSLANIGGSPVVGIPRDISWYVAGRRFEVYTQEGTPAGTIAVDESGMSWGYGPFLRRRGAEPGDTLTLRFDLTNEHVTLTLGDESALVDESG